MITINIEKESKAGKLREHFSLKTGAGCKRLFAVFAIIILVSSMCARFISTDGGRIKVEQITIDARGAALSGELYYPAGVSDHDKLPAVILAHGGGCNYGVLRGIASELARRGFVVVNMSAYGSGTSEVPLYDDGGQGVEKYNGSNTPLGYLDTLNFVRSLKFVDTTRIGMAGHSMGSRRTAYTAILDCGYLSFNDIMVNVLHDTFGQTFTIGEINTDADTLAIARLNSDQLKTYYILKATNRTSFDSKLKAALILGGNGSNVNPTKKVSVGGYSVSRNCQVNLGFVNGSYDNSYYTFNTGTSAKAAWYTGANIITLESWYVLNDVTASSAILGGFYNISVASNNNLASAIQNRTSRICMLNPETHSKNFFSTETTADVVKFFEQTLGYNNGNLTSASTVTLDPYSQIWIWRAVFNCIAMFAMFAMVVPLLGMMLQTKFFASCVAPLPADIKPKFNKWFFAVFMLMTIGFTYFATWWANKKGLFYQTPNVELPLTRGASLTFVFLGVAALGTLGLLAICYILAKFILVRHRGTKFKDILRNSSGFNVLNIGMKFKDIMKCILAGTIMVGTAYLALSVVQYLFNEDFRLWMTSFTYMKADYWYLALKYAAILFPIFFVISAGINYAKRRDLPGWLDMLIIVLANALGVWLVCFVNIQLMHPFTGTLYSNFYCSWQLCLLVPVTVFLSRKVYNMTNNIWVSSAFITLLIAWEMVSVLGVNDTYTPQTALGNFLGF